jgi:hypothetical protein
VRPPAGKLAASSQIVDERAWDVDEQSGRLALKTGPTEFSFGRVYCLSVTASALANNLTQIRSSRDPTTKAFTRRQARISCCASPSIEVKINADVDIYAIAPPWKALTL